MERELTWGRGSSLSRLTDSTDGVLHTIAQAHRDMRDAIPSEGLAALNDAAHKAQAAAARFGLAPRHGKYRAGLDTEVSTGTGGLTLHDGLVPARMLGQGSKRLLALGIQEASVPEGAILLIDEVEHGLEPHRLRNMLQLLKGPREQTQEIASKAQVFVTTHSPVSIEELQASELCIVRSDGASTTVKQAPAELQQTFIHAPEAPLAEKIIVCEGLTEYGVLRALDIVWASEPEGNSFAYLSVVPVVHRRGGGDASPKLARELASLGYNVALVIDSDKKFKVPNSMDALRDVGVRVIQWEGNTAIEERACYDLPWNALQDILNLAFELDYHGHQAVLNAIGAKLNCTFKAGTSDESINTWLGKNTEEEIRSTIGAVAKKSGWFKNTEAGEKFGELIARQLSVIPSADLSRKLLDLREWVYDN